MTSKSQVEIDAGQIFIAIYNDEGGVSRLAFRSANVDCSSSIPSKVGSASMPSVALI